MKCSKSSVATSAGCTTGSTVDARFDRVDERFDGAMINNVNRDLLDRIDYDRADLATIRVDIEDSRSLKLQAWAIGVGLATALAVV